MSISVGQVSGIIAAAVFITQLLFPNALVIVLACVLDAEHTAVTWSVVQRQLGNSLWPTILNSDTAASRHVQRRVNYLALFRPVGVALIAVAAVVTPLGLYDAVLPDRYMQEVAFTYLLDNGPMGYGTPPQGSDIYLNRDCGGWGGPSNCPGAYNPEIITTYPGNFPNSTEPTHTYNISIPQYQIDLYTSGRGKFSPTVASFFDIKSRQYTFSSDPDKNGGEPFPVNNFRMLNSIILDDKIEAVEGLVVDMKSVGVGFRNHTLPLSVNQAAEWTEDLLWLEPLTECVDTNLTLEFTLPNGQAMVSMYIINLTLVDNGGFANLTQKFPVLNMEDNQNDPKLHERAYQAAWMVNTYSALILNVTRPSPNAFAYLNSEVGKRFPLDSGIGSTIAGPSGITVDLQFSKLVDPRANTRTTTNHTSFVDNSTVTTTTGLYTNPFNVTSSNYSDIQTLCQGSGQADWANSSNIQVQCGLFFAAAQRVNGDPESLVLRPNDTYRQSVYTCATVNKVSLKTVGLRYNTTLTYGKGELTGLTVLNISDKVYKSKEEMPLWAIEQPDYQFRISDIEQLWGMVDDNYDVSKAKKDGVALKRAAELYLPGYTWGTGLMANFPGFEYVPAANMPKAVLASAYEIGGASTPVYDYSGVTNLALSRKWQKMSRDLGKGGVPRILSLIWTDLAANALQGGRGWQGGFNSGTIANKDAEQSSGNDGAGVMVPVLIYRKRVCYRWIYAIPAFIALAMFALLCLTAVVLSVMRQGPARVKYYLDELSAGRLLARQHYPDQCETKMSTKVWIEKVGREVVDISTGVDLSTGVDVNGNGGTKQTYEVKGCAEEATIEVDEVGESSPLSHGSGRERDMMTNVWSTGRT